MNKKVMLMYPNFRWGGDWMERTVWLTHPYNLGILAATLEDKFDVNIFDGNLDNTTKDEFKGVISEQNPAILGISVLTNEYGAAGYESARLAKEVNPDIKVVMGGVHVTSLPNEVIKNPNVDYAVIGEGEGVLDSLCNSIFGKGELPKKGIVYKKNGGIVNTGRADFISDLDSIPFPAYSKVNFKRYANQEQRYDVGRAREKPYAITMTSRGCPYNCCFCEVETISGKRLRLRSVENIIEEFDWLVNDYGIKSIIFHDDNLIGNKERAKELFRQMGHRSYKLKWNAAALALFKLDEEMIDLMKESGCEYVNVAIESGVERVLKEIIHKPLGLEDGGLERGKKMIKKLKEQKIDVAASFVIGFPGETWGEIRENLRFAEEIDVDYVQIAIATPLPNTELYRIALEGGYLAEDFSFDRHNWTDGQIETPEFRRRDLTILRAYEWDRINFSNSAKRAKVARMMEITEERLGEIRKDTLKRANP